MVSSLKTLGKREMFSLSNKNKYFEKLRYVRVLLDVRACPLHAPGEDGLLPKNDNGEEEMHDVTLLVQASRGTGTPKTEYCKSSVRPCMLKVQV